MIKVIYHGHDLPAAFPLLMIGKLFRKKVIYDSHELYTEQDEYFNSLINRIWRFIEKKILNSFSDVIAVNDSRADIMKSEYGLWRRPQVIGNYPEEYLELKNKTSYFLDYIRNKTGAVDGKIVLYQGGLDENRSLKALIEAFNFVMDGVYLILMGPETSNGLNYEAIIKKNHLNSRVFIHPAVKSSELLNLVSSADLGVVIYKNNCRNNFLCAPNKIFEYIASDIPIIGSDLPEISKVVNSNKIGLLFEENKAKKLRKLLIKLYLR